MAQMVVIYRTPKNVEALTDITSKSTCLSPRRFQVSGSTRSATASSQRQ
jgi:hypothetical protein